MGMLRPHFRGEFVEPFPVDEARALLRAAPGLELIENFEANRFPMHIDVTGRDPVAVGREVVEEALSDLA